MTHGQISVQHQDLNRCQTPRRAEERKNDPCRATPGNLPWPLGTKAESFMVQSPSTCIGEN